MLDFREVTDAILSATEGKLENIDPGKGAKDVIERIERAIKPDHGDKAFDIAFHLSDWSSDAAFLVALHLCPDKFTDEQIRDGVMMFVVHAPNHAAAAAKLAGCPVEDVFDWPLRSPD